MNSIEVFKNTLIKIARRKSVMSKSVIFAFKDEQAEKASEYFYH